MAFSPKWRDVIFEVITSLVHGIKLSIGMQILSQILVFLKEYLQWSYTLSQLDSLFGFNGSKVLQYDIPQFKRSTYVADVLLWKQLLHFFFVSSLINYMQPQ